MQLHDRMPFAVEKGKSKQKTENDLLQYAENIQSFHSKRTESADSNLFIVGWIADDVCVS